jgi:hypothetical protein
MDVDDGRWIPQEDGGFYKPAREGYGSRDGWGWTKLGPYVKDFHKEAARAIEAGRRELESCHKMEAAGYKFLDQSPGNRPHIWEVGWKSPEVALAQRYHGELHGRCYVQATHYRDCMSDYDWWQAMKDQGMKIGLVFPAGTPLRYRFSGNSNPVTYIDAMTLEVAQQMDAVKTAGVALLALERPSRAKDLLRLTGGAPPRPKTADVSAPWLVARIMWNDSCERLRGINGSHIMFEDQVTKAVPVKRARTRSYTFQEWYARMTILGKVE